MGADLVGVWVHGTHNAAAVDHFKEDVFWRGMFAIRGLAAIAGWWTFARLEVIEGHRDIALPGWLTFAPRRDLRSSTRSGHFVRALLAKELRLQQITYVLAVLYAATVLTLPWLSTETSATLYDARGGLTVLYAGFAALLIGSLSSAQERHLGTLEWQALQPVPAWKQWALKVSVGWMLAIVLGVALPIVLGIRHGSPRFRQLPPEWMVVNLVFLTTAGLYLSSLCRNSMSAFILAVPVTGGVGGPSSGLSGRLPSNPLPVLYSVRQCAATRLPFRYSRALARRDGRTSRRAVVVWIRQPPHVRSECCSHGEAGARDWRVRHHGNDRVDRFDARLGGRQCRAAP